MTGVLMSKPYSNAELLKGYLLDLGYSSKSFMLEQESFTQFISPNEDVWIINNDRISYPFATTGSLLLAKSKIWSNELVQQVGGNIPVTYKVSTNSSSPLYEKILSEQSMVIVKPYDSTLSRGLTTDIDTPEKLEIAIKHAHEFSDTALVQQQVYGDDIRFILIDGRVKSVLLRQTPRVVGDGESTLAELIKKENEERNQIELPFGQHYRILTENYIPKDYVESTRVLEKGTVLELSREVLVRMGASIYNIMTEIHPSYVKEIERIASYLGRGYLAVDVFIQDYTIENDGNNYWFLEFNSSPSLALPYCVRDGNHYCVLDDLIPMLDRALTR